jgi:hypothetical protein
MLSILLISALGTGGACAMNQKRGSSGYRCSVTGNEKMAEAAGGSAALCAEIGKALAEVRHADTATVEIQVRRSHLSATVKLADGRTLPEIGLAVSDAPLSGNAIKSFALQIAMAVREATI